MLQLTRPKSWTKAQERNKRIIYTDLPNVYIIINKGNNPEEWHMRTVDHIIPQTYGLKIRNVLYSNTFLDRSEMELYLAFAHGLTLSDDDTNYL